VPISSKYTPFAYGSIVTSAFMVIII